MLFQQTLIKYRVIAVIRSPSLEIGLKMAQAVADGGIRLIEVIWNSVEPLNLIEQLQQKLPDCIIGVGTIITPEDLKKAIAANIQFCFSPHTDLKLIEIAQKCQIPMIPGALTPTEIVKAWQNGASAVKVFPIEAVGGASYIRSLKPPLGQIPLIPTGGVTLDNANTMIEAGAIAVGLSGHLFPKEAIKNGDWGLITEKARELNAKLGK